MTGPINITKTSCDYKTETWNGIRESKYGMDIVDILQCIFQLLATAVMIKKVCKGQYSDTVVLVTCLLTCII